MAACTIVVACMKDVPFSKASKGIRPELIQQGRGGQG
jgi:hypothetical protein